MSIGLQFCWSSTTYHFLPTAEMKSGGTRFFYRWACYHPSCWDPSDRLQIPPRYMAEDSTKIGAQGLSRTHSKLHFHSASATCPRGDPHGILPHFYPPHFFNLCIGMDHWSLPIGLDLATLMFSTCGSWHNFTAILWSPLRGSTTLILSATPWKEWIPRIFFH